MLIGFSGDGNFVCFSMKELALEQEHGRLQQQLREKMTVSPEEKSREDLQAEHKILERMLAVVSERDCLVTQLEKERQRYSD